MGWPQQIDYTKSEFMDLSPGKGKVAAVGSSIQVHYSTEPKTKKKVFLHDITAKNLITWVNTSLNIQKIYRSRLVDGKIAFVCSRLANRYIIQE